MLCKYTRSVRLLVLEHLNLSILFKLILIILMEEQSAILMSSKIHFVVSHLRCWVAGQSRFILVLEDLLLLPPVAGSGTEPTKQLADTDVCRRMLS